MPVMPAPAALTGTLSNGLEWIVIPCGSLPVVSTQVWVKSGSIHEDPFVGAGISHFIEHLVFKGTASLGPLEAANVVQAAGGRLNAYTSYDRTVFFADGPVEGLESFLRVTTDLAFRPRFPRRNSRRNAK